MADVRIDINAQDNASPVVKGVENSLKGLDKQSQTSADAQKALDMAFRQTDMSTLQGQVSSFSKQLKADTPQNRQYALSLSDIKNQYEAGSISASEASKRVAEIEKAMGKADGATGKFGAALGTAAKTIGAVTAAAAIMGTTMNQAFEIGLAGAKVNQQTESFKTLLGVIGAAPDTLNRLRTASRGTISDMALMSSTSTLLAGSSDEMAKAMADAAPDILGLADAANKLNPTLGSTEFLYQSLMTGIKRGSPMLIDNTGLTVRLGEANEEYARSIGKTVDELTDEERKMALLNGVLAAGDNLLRQVGGSADSATDPFERLAATTANIGDTMKARFAPPLADAADALYLILTRTQQVNGILGDHIDQVGNTSKSYDEYIAEVERAADAANYHVVTKDGEVKIMRQVGAVMKEVTEAGRVMTEQEWLSREAAIESDRALQGMALSLENVVPPAGDAADAIAETEGAAAGAETAISAYDQHMAYLGDRMREMSEQVRTAQQEMADAQAEWQAGAGNDAASMLRQQGLEGQALIDALAGVDEVMGTSLSTQEQYNQKMQAAAEAFAESKDMDAYKEALRGIKEEFMPLNEQVMAATTKLIKLKALFDLMNGKEIRMYVNVEQRGNVPGGSGGGYTPNVSPTPTPELQATGGQVFRGGYYMMNEYAPTRPETFVASENGAVLTRQDAMEAMRAGGGGGGVTINVYQQPGENGEQLANRLLGKLSRVSAAAGIRSAGG